jgi:soluble lytic murein transglycosylase
MTSCLSSIRRMASPLFTVALVLTLAAAGHPARAQGFQPGDDPAVEAREALRKKDKARLLALRTSTLKSGHPLAMWVDYWELSNRLPDAQQGELDAFYARWPDTYVEDRLRNDWLLELGKRRDWANFARDMPAFRMNDDREVTCYSLLVRHQGGEKVADAARAAWFAQRDADDGCDLLASTLYAAGVFTTSDLWMEARLSVEANRPRAARAAAAIVSPAASLAVGDALDKPETALKRAAGRRDLDDGSAQVALLALMRLAANDPDAAAALLEGGWQRRLPAPLAAAAWASVGKQAALKLQPQAFEHYQRGWQLLGKSPAPDWSDDTLAWMVRAALRSTDGERWLALQRAVDAMSATEQRDPAWVYWRARATLALAKPGGDGDADRVAARQALQGIAVQMSFYGKLATEELGGRVVLPPPAAAPTEAELKAARSEPGLSRALLLIALGLRNEGVREWNYMLRGLGDRELLAAAQAACEREVWDRCINTSDRTRAEVNMGQRFPMPFRAEVLAKAREIGLDPAFMYGLIRQESRFILDARSGVGASGLMQVMPATAKWTARKIGMTDFRPEMITERDTNLRIGASYLRFVLDDFGGSQAMAAAAYNAGPNRPRRWREGPVLETAAWAENIPFTETRDYVKKVLSNAVYYGALIGAPPPSLKTRLAGPIGPRDPAAPTSNGELP